MVPNSGYTLMGITWWLVCMTTIALGLRFYVRGRGKSQIASDDWTMLTAWILLFASQILLSVVYANGLGQTDNLTMDQRMNIYKFQWISITPANLSSVFSRVSIAIFLSRVFSVKKWFRWYLVATTFVASCLDVTVLVELWASCSPVSALWNPAVAKTAKCLDPKIFTRLGYAYQAMLTLTDFTFVLFPVIFVWKLKMATKKKAGLVAIFCLGLFTTVASIMKLLTVQSTSKQQSHLSGTIPSLIWGVTEAALVIILGCILTLRPLFAGRFANIRRSLSRSLSFVKPTSATHASTTSEKNIDPNQSDPHDHNSPDYEFKASFKSVDSSMLPRSDSQASTVYVENSRRSDEEC